jgi:hypothetical protein
MAAQRMPDRGKAQDSAQASRTTTAAFDPFLQALQIALSGAAVPVAPSAAANPVAPKFGSFASAGDNEHSPEPTALAASGDPPANPAAAPPFSADFSQSRKWSFAPVPPNRLSSIASPMSGNDKAVAEATAEMETAAPKLSARVAPPIDHAAGSGSSSVGRNVKAIWQSVEAAAVKSGKSLVRVFAPIPSQTAPAAPNGQFKSLVYPDQDQNSGIQSSAQQQSALQPQTPAQGQDLDAKVQPSQHAAKPLPVAME